AYEPPEDLLEAWRVSLMRRRSVGAAELARLARLSGLQLNGLTRLGGLPSEPPGTGLDDPGVREFLAAFPATDRAKPAALPGAGLWIGPEGSAASAALLKPFTMLPGQVSDQPVHL